MDAVLYVRASGRHVLVEEDTVNAQGAPNGAEHIVFSRWGEVVRPQAPEASFTLGSVSTDVRGNLPQRDGLSRPPWENAPLSSRRRGCRRESTCDAVTE